ncbi:hypothetical protein [Neobacillus sp. LXY-1]|uniref:hypothetical protein n=1 Tax=Neobacillus sp. LXY-1 TaxID=3379133 RepID=UPI003EE0E7C1
MANEKTYNPLESYKRMSELWEKQMNGLLYMMTDNKETVSLMKLGVDGYSRYLQLLRRNQDLMASFLNIPSKKDVAKVAKISIQAEEKIDILEEQIWNMQDGIAQLNKDHLEMFQELVNIITQMKNEFQKLGEEMAESQKISSDIHELRHGLVDIKIIQVNLQELRKEIDTIKGIKTELKQLKEAQKTNNLQSEIQDLKLGVMQLPDILQELSELKTLIEKEKKKELELSTTGPSN